MRTPIVLALLVAGAALLAAPGLAITGGTPDGDAHPAVGALVAEGRVVCSGTLVAPAVFLTAGHCTAPVDGARVGVVFGASVDASTSPLHAGTARTSPGYGDDRKDSRDLGIVVLDRAVKGIAPARVAPVGLLDELDVRRADVVSVGYGYVRSADATKKDPGFTYDGIRRVTTSTVKGVSATELKLDVRDGGPCFGDSGGPQLAGDVVVSVTSHGDDACTRTAYGYRLDTPSARAFLSAYGL